MALRLVYVLVFTAFISACGAIPPPPPTECGPNAERQKCGSACVPTCSNPNPGPTCILPCVDGCFCKPGYLKSANNQCVRPEDCETVHRIPMQIPSVSLVSFDDKPQQKCDENEEYKTCGPMCAGSCVRPQGIPFCSLRCNPACFCKPGYLRNRDRKCVLAEKCVQPEVIPAQEKCGQNEEYRNCGPVCETTCKKHLISFCSLRCKQGCFCKEGHVRDRDSKCIPSEQCPREELAIEAAVTMPLHRMTLKPDMSSTKPGPIKIPLSMIPAEIHCPNPDEEYHPCGVQVDCLARCKIQTTPKCMERNCAPACVCRQPFVRNEQGRCVKQTECPKAMSF